MEFVGVADGILAAVQPSVGFGAVNSAAVIEDDGIAVIDACTVPSQARAFADVLAQTAPAIHRHHRPCSGSWVWPDPDLG